MLNAFSIQADYLALAAKNYISFNLANLANGWISEVLKRFLRCALILGQRSEGAGGWDRGESAARGQMDGMD